MRLATFLRTPLFLVVMFLAGPASAGPGGGPRGVESFGTAVLDFLTGPMAILVLGIGIAVAAWGLIFGSRDALMKAIYAIVGGVLLFSVDSITDFVQAASGG